jgi:hypothetical protein
MVAQILSILTGFLPSNIVKASKDRLIGKLSNLLSYIIVETMNTRETMSQEPWYGIISYS